MKYIICNDEKNTKIDIDMFECARPILRAESIFQDSFMVGPDITSWTIQLWLLNKYKVTLIYDTEDKFNRDIERFSNLFQTGEIEIH